MITAWRLRMADLRAILRKAELSTGVKLSPPGGKLKKMCYGFEEGGGSETVGFWKRRWPSRNAPADRAPPAAELDCYAA